MYYEKIEEIGIDRLMDYSQERRDSILLHMPHDELVCLFHFMNVKDVRELFSADVIKDCFYNIPVEYTFPLLTECKSFYKHFLSSTDIKERIEYMSLTLFYEEMVHHYDTLKRLLRDKIITRKLIQSKFHSISLSKLATICKRYPIWKTWVHPHPLLERLPFPTDVSIHIFSFL